MYLLCRRCGVQTPGWDVSPRAPSNPTPPPLRLLLDDRDTTFTRVRPCSTMAKVLLRVREAEELESKARAQAEQKAAQRHRLEAAGTLLPPPEADLLGTWQVVEQRIEMLGDSVESELGRHLIRFEVLGPERTFFGTYEDSNFLLTSGRYAGTRWPQTVRGIVDGKFSEPSRIRCRFLPQEGWHLRRDDGGVMRLGELMEATLDSGTMEGVFENDRIGTRAQFLGVKLED